MRVTIRPSPRASKKLVATFYDDDGSRVKSVHFGAAGYQDYIRYSRDQPAIASKRRLAYIRRHRKREDWRDPMTAGALSRWILWEKKTLPAATRKYKVLFGFI